MQAMSAVDDPPGSRLFVVCGRAVEEETLRAAFVPHGNVQNVKLLKEKGVCYVKFDKASSAALAMEALNGAVLNNGRGPKLKVLLAEAPTPRGVAGPPKVLLPEEPASSDPDNIPPRSRLFLVVPKTAEARLIHDELGRYPDLEYCKTDLIASKGVVFVKYAKASSALTALEEIAAKGMLCSYKVKVMLAEPKTKRPRGGDLAGLGLFGHVSPLGHLPQLGLDAAGAMRLPPAAAGQFGAFGLGAAASSMLAAQQAALAAQQAAAAGEYAPLSGFVGLHGAGGLAAAAAAAAAAAGAGDGSGMGPSDLAGQAGGLGFGGGLSHMQLMAPLAGPSEQPGMPGSLAGHAAAAAAAGAAAVAASQAGGCGGPFPHHHGPAGGSHMGAGLGGMPGLPFPPQLAGFMGFSQGGGSGGLMAGHPAAVAVAAAAAAAASGAELGGGQHGGGGPPLSQQRLFVVVHKSVSDDQLRLLFRQYPGMEYCDLKRDKATGKSKGYCYVNYSTPAAAAAAVSDLNGIEFPPGSGFRLKVMYAEIMTGGGGGGSAAAMAAMAGGMMHAMGHPTLAGGAPHGAMLRSNSRSSLRTPSAGQLVPLGRSGSGSLSHQHSSGSLGGVAVGSMSGPLPGGPSSGGGGPLGSRGPSPSATPLGQELATLTDSLGSLSLPSQRSGGPPAGVSSISSDAGSDAAAAAAVAAAAQQHHHYELSAAVSAAGGNSTVARELMFNVG